MRLGEEEFAKRFEVSRTPVREALLGSKRNSSAEKIAAAHRTRRRHRDA